MCVLAPVLGSARGRGMFMLAFPPPHAAKASLVLTYDPQVEPTRAMATNVSLLRTQTLATRTIARLGLTTTPDDFLKSFTIEPVGSELLILTLAAPDDAEAVRRLDASDVGLPGVPVRAALLAVECLSWMAYGSASQKLQADVEASRSRSKALGGRQPERQQVGRRDRPARIHPGPNRNLAAVHRGCHVAQQRRGGVQQGARPPDREPGRAKRAHCAGLASGLIGGAALGCGAVLFFAITSDRLRRRSDVASALGVAVPVSVGRIAPLSKRVALVAPLRARTAAVPMSGSDWPTRSRWSFRHRPAPVGLLSPASTTQMRSATPLPRPWRTLPQVDARSPPSMSPSVAASPRSPRRSPRRPAPSVLRPRGLPALPKRPS